MCLLCVVVKRGIQEGPGAERQGRSLPEIALNAPCDRFERSHNLHLTDLCFVGVCWTHNKRTFRRKSEPGVQALCEPDILGNFQKDASELCLFKGGAECLVLVLHSTKFLVTGGAKVG